MKIIVGLGNPGSEYAGTRHNIGFMVLDRLAADHGAGAWRGKFHSLAADALIGREKVLLLKPETYMNESGRAVRAAMDWCKVSPQDVMIVCDDFHLALGRLRVRSQGSSGGHHGLDSIIEHLATDAVPRLRVGIGSERGERGRDFVLSTFRPDERTTVEAGVKRAAQAVEVWVESGIRRCQNEFNADPDAQAQQQKEEGDA